MNPAALTASNQPQPQPPQQAQQQQFSHSIVPPTAVSALPPGASAPDRRGAGSAGLTVIKLIAFFSRHSCLFITSIKVKQFYGLLSRDQLIKCKKWLFKVWFWIRLGSPLYKFCVFQRKLSDSPKSIGKKLAFKTFFFAATLSSQKATFAKKVKEPDVEHQLPFNCFQSQKTSAAQIILALFQAILFQFFD